jgi:hypothetical protein
MKWLLVILFLLLVSIAQAADLVVSNNAIIVLNGDSFMIGGTSTNSSGYRTPDYIASYFKLNYPGSNISTFNISRAGGNMFEILTNREQAADLSIFGYQSNAFQKIGVVHGTDNGGLNVLQMFQAASNVMLFPTLMSDGDSNLVTHPGLVVTSVQWIGFGDPPGGAATGGYDANPNNPARNNINIGITNAGWLVGVRGIEAYFSLSNSWVTDYLANGGTNIQFIYIPAEHFESGGALSWAMVFLRGITTDTNISTAVLSWTDGSVVQTNHCCVVSNSISGNVLTFTRKDDRLPFAFDQAHGSITNDCAGAFRLNPSDADYFKYILRVTGLPPGSYQYREDGTLVGTYTDVQLAAGVNLFTNMSLGPTALQRGETLGCERDLEQVDRVTLIPKSIGATGMLDYFSSIGAQWDLDKGNKRGNALIAGMNSSAAQVFGLDALAGTAAIPTNHIDTLTKINVLNVGTLNVYANLVPRRDANGLAIPGHWDARYSAGFNSSNYNWYAQVSTDLVHWTLWGSHTLDDTDDIVYRVPKGTKQVYAQLVGYPKVGGADGQ